VPTNLSFSTHHFSSNPFVAHVTPPFLFVYVQNPIRKSKYTHPGWAMPSNASRTLSLAATQLATDETWIRHPPKPSLTAPWARADTLRSPWAKAAEILKQYRTFAVSACKALGSAFSVRLRPGFRSPKITCACANMVSSCHLSSTPPRHRRPQRRSRAP